MITTENGENLKHFARFSRNFNGSNRDLVENGLDLSKSTKTRQKRLKELVCLGCSSFGGGEPSSDLLASILRGRDKSPIARVVGLVSIKLVPVDFGKWLDSLRP